MNVGLADAAELPLWATLTVLGLIANGLLDGNMKGDLQ
jgi:hypothetical protein